MCSFYNNYIGIVGAILHAYKATFSDYEQSIVNKEKNYGSKVELEEKNRECLCLLFCFYHKTRMGA